MRLNSTRPAAVAGSWYPASAGALTRDVDGYVAATGPNEALPRGRLDAVIAPHAGLMFSGPVGAYAYKAAAAAGPFDTVILVGPSHFEAFEGVAVYPAGAFDSPLGPAPIDEALSQALMAASPLIQPLPEAHTREHSLEMQLPFIRRLLPNAAIVPLLMGYQTRETIQGLAEALAAADYADHADKNTKAADYADHADKNTKAADYADHADKNTKAADYADHADKNTKAADYADHADKNTKAADYADHAENTKAADYADHADKNTKAAEHAELNKKKVLLVASTDLSHFFDAAAAEALDRRVADCVAACDPDRLLQIFEQYPERERGRFVACGGGPAIAVMLAARARGARHGRVLKYMHSGQISGDNSGVVGYLAGALGTFSEERTSDSE